MKSLYGLIAGILLTFVPSSVLRDSKIEIKIPKLYSNECFEDYYKLYDVQQKINKSNKKNKDYWQLVIYRDKLREEQRKLEEIIANNSKFKIEVIKKDFILNLYENGFLVKTYPIAIGKLNKKKESKTINGSYTVIDKYERPYFPESRKFKRVGGFDIGSKEGIMIHGTFEEESIGKAVSKGCIRLKRKDALELISLIPVGTTVEIK